MVDEVGLEPTNPKELIYSQSALPNLRTHPYNWLNCQGTMKNKIARGFYASGDSIFRK